MVKRETMMLLMTEEIEIGIEVKPQVWVTKFREKIPVKEMSTSHIKNCIRAFKAGRIPFGYLGGWLKWRKIFKEELISRQ